MNFDRDPSNSDEYFVTALQIFDCCGVESSDSLRVDALMDKFAPFVKTNKTEYSILKSLLDPEQSNPTINVTKLAKALHKYSESQKTKVDLEESFNLKTGAAPHDSDSGISTDGLQLLEDLQCELKEKEHLAHQLRSQLDFTDRQHEESLAALVAERDSLWTHLNIVREENATLCHVRHDYDEACERLCASETALDDTKRELESHKKRSRVSQEQIATLEHDKLTLQELLSKSKDECHRINEMYASRQSALLEENETLKSERADLAARFQDQEEFMQQMIKEKVLLEMELKDVLNKSNQTHLRLDRSIDVSYTEDQMLTALDSLNSDTRFGPENRLLDDESFVSALKDDYGRTTNMSLFDEIRFSFCNISRQNADLDFDKDRSISNHSLVNSGTQTDDIEIKTCDSRKDVCISDTPLRDKSECIDNTDSILVAVETQNNNEIEPYVNNDKVDANIPVKDMCVSYNAEIQTDECEILLVDKNKVVIKTDSQATQTEKMWKPRKHIKNRVLNTKTKISTMAAEAQTDICELTNINNNLRNTECFQCIDSHIHTAKLERDLKYSNLVMSEVHVEIAKYEENLVHLQRMIDEGKDKNVILQSVVEDLNAKIQIFENACDKQSEVINNILDTEVCCVDCQTETDQSSVSTQVEVPCVECDKRNAVLPHRNLRRFFWDPLKCLFQLFAVVCFVGAICILAGVARNAAGGTCRTAPWKWMHAQDIMDLLLRIEYTAEVPM